MPRKLASLFALLASIGCATAKERGPVIADTLCGLARAQIARCDSGQDLDRNRCRAAEAAVIVCSIGGHVRAEQGLIAGLSPGVGYVPRSLQTCWRERVSGPVKCGVGRLDVDPWLVAGMPGASQGGLPCDREIVNEAYRQAFGHPCRGEGAPLGGYIEVSNEVLRGAVVELEWACRNRPDLLQSEGSRAWDCRPSGLDMIRLAAHRGGGQVIAAIRSAMPQDPPPGPVCGNGIKETGESCSTCPRDVPGCPVCGNGRPESGETCANCPLDLGACPPPPDGKADCSTIILPAPGAPQRIEVLPTTASTGVDVRGIVTFECRGATTLPAPPACIPATQKATACACKGLREPRKAACLALCAWATGLPNC